MKTFRASVPCPTLVFRVRCCNDDDNYDNDDDDDEDDDIDN